MRHILCACLLFTLVTTTRGAEQPHADITFLTVEQAKAAIVDESVEPYFSLLQRQEMASKTGSAISGENIDAQRDICRKRYQAAMKEFSPAEQAALTATVAE